MESVIVAVQHIAIAYSHSSILREGNIMLDTMMKPFEGAMKPMSELAAINAKALEKLAEHQTALFSDMLKAGVTYSEDVTSIKDLAAFVDMNKTVAEDMQSKIVTAAKEAYALATSTQEEAAEVLKGAFADAQESIKAAAPKAAAPKAAPKPAAK
jgi:phasin family protein